MDEVFSKYETLRTPFSELHSSCKSAQRDLDSAMQAASRRAKKEEEKRLAGKETPAKKDKQQELKESSKKQVQSE